MSRHRLILIISGLTFSINAAFSQTVTEQFAWLVGTWEGKMGEATFTETWSWLEWEVLIGEGHAVADGDTIFSEYLRIDKPNDTCTYTARVGSDPPVAFALTSSEKNSWIFENPAHDYPQKIGYRKEKKGKVLMAWTDGMSEGERVVEEFPMVKLIEEWEE